MAENFYHLQDMIQYAAAGITSKVLARSRTFSLTLMSMAAGTELEEHSTPRAGVVETLKGAGAFWLGGEWINMKPGVMIHMAPDAPHALKAESPMSFLLTLYE